MMMRRRLAAVAGMVMTMLWRQGHWAAMVSGQDCSP
jgi:hypothetical protein